jgi:hypothetical protein
MIALTGCDFCNSMPVIGPAKLWAAKHATRGLDFATPEGVLAAVTAAYQLSFSKHIRPARQGDIVSASRDAAESIGMYESVRRNITSNSSTSQKHKDSIWTARHMHLHVLNVSWTVGEYWSRLGLYADPVCERYGYKNNAKGNCEFMTD